MGPVSPGNAEGSTRSIESRSHFGPQPAELETTVASERSWAKPATPFRSSKYFMESPGLAENDSTCGDQRTPVEPFIIESFFIDYFNVRSNSFRYVAKKIRVFTQHFTIEIARFR